MVNFYLISYLLTYQFFQILSEQYLHVPLKQANKDGSISVVTKTGKFESSIYDFDDLYFEVIKPQEISYTFRIKLAKSFGSEFSTVLKNIKLIPADPYDACQPIINSKDLIGNVALVIRGDCSFTTKAVNVEDTGAVAVIITDNDPLNESMIDMVNDETQRIVHIPSVYLPWKDGYMIKKSIDNTKTRAAIINIPLNTTHTSGKILNKRAPWTQW
ncbi:unnamed protein product [Brachionus calyciflorus]|uniref:PA domain-containing protein n=1 Tax=Brachionus calyciflorus TaxID=104777 RepID=A0A813RWC1_9BILA|nr:unnamed protein product [Brachionus calyciflorus]